MPTPLPPSSAPPRSPAQSERAALAALLAEVGPDAPTLCEGWTTRDLAAHLVVREGSPLAGPGIVLGGPAAALTRRLQDRQRDGSDYAELVEAVRTGPPRRSVMAVPGLRDALALHEYFVHHEDVLRAVGRTRTRGAALEDALWVRLRQTARLLFRRAPVGVRLARAGASGAREEVTARGGPPEVVATGAAGELLLLALGRGEHAAVRLTGPDDAVAALRTADLGV